MFLLHSQVSQGAIIPSTSPISYHIPQAIWLDGIELQSNFVTTRFSTLTIGLQSITEELMYTIPLRDTVAGEALSMLCGSKTTLHWGDIGIRSPLANVNVLLSSSTLFRFSIQMASTGPSRTIHMCSPRKKDDMGETLSWKTKQNDHKLVS